MDSRAIGRKMREYREKNGLYQFQLGKMLFVSEATIWKIENGERVPSLETCIKIAELFGCSLDELVSEPGEENVKARFLSGVWNLAEEILIRSNDEK